MFAYSRFNVPCKFETLISSDHHLYTAAATTKNISDCLDFFFENDFIIFILLPLHLCLMAVAEVSSRAAVWSGG